MIGLMLKRHQDLFPLEKSRVVAITKAHFKQINHPTAGFSIKLFCTLVNYSTYIRCYLSCI
jgi:hypothetical protein